MPNPKSVQDRDTDTLASAEGVGGPLILGRYRLGRRLGTGGFGTVWLARDERLDRMVAVKRIEVGDADVAKRAEREAKAAARLSHPAIVALYETARDDEAVYLVSELVRGETLGQLIEEGALSDRDVCEIGVALCDALAHAHQRGVTHRDVKPANIIVPEDGTGVVKLTDFGIARLHGEDVLTRTGDIVGTLAYMAPEQADGKDAAAPADLYALALVLYEALAGVNPVRGRTPGATARRIGVRLPPLERMRRDLPLELCRAIDRGVLPRPGERGKLKDLRVELKAATGEVEDDPGTVEAGRLETMTRVTRMAVGGARRSVQLDDEASGEPWAEVEGEGHAVPRRPPATPSGRAVAGVLAGGLATAALATLGPEPPVVPLAGGVIAAAVVALLPRLGWCALAAALTAWLLIAPEGSNPDAGGSIAQGSGGLAVVLLAGVVPTVLALWRTSGTWWSAPGLAPALGLLGLAGVYPVVAGQSWRFTTRAALGALGAWWLLLGELLTGRQLLLGLPPQTHQRVTWGASAEEAITHGLWPLLSGGALALCALWAVAAVILPFLVRGRAASLDLVAATIWAVALATATTAVAGALAWTPVPHGLIASAILGGAAAVGARAWRA